MIRVHIGDTFTINGSGFEESQGDKWVKVDGVEAEVLAWSDSSITIIVPEPTINENGYVDISIGNDSESYTFTDAIWILLGGILRFVEPTNWSEVRLDLDNGGEGYDAEIWQQQGTMIPPPASSSTYLTPDVKDGEQLVLSRLPNKEVTLNLLFTATNKAKLDALFSDFLKEIYRDSNCLEYRPEGSSESIYYTTFRVSEQPEIPDYFTHKPRRSEGGYAYSCLIKLPCLPWAEMAEEELSVINNLFPNGSLEQTGSGNGFNNYDEAVSGSATVTLNTTQYMLPGGASCKLTTTAAAEYAQITDAAKIAVDSSKKHNIQCFAYKHEGTIKLSVTMYCFDSDGVACTPASLTLLDEQSPTDTGAWTDMMVLHGEPVIYEEGSLNPNATADNTFPNGTASVQFEFKQVGSATETAAVSIDALLFSESEYISDHLCEASIGIVVPPDIFRGDIPAPLDIYISGAFGGEQWTPQQAGTYVLYGLHYEDGDTAFAVGASGQILSWNGSAWTLESSGVSVNLRSITYVGASNIWTVGDGGTIRKYGGASWAGETYPASTELIVDGSFASWNDAWDPIYWSQYSDGSDYQVIREQAYERTHPYACWLEVNSGTYTQIYSKSFITAFNPYKDYTLTWYGRRHPLQNQRVSYVQPFLRVYNSGGTLIQTKSGIKRTIGTSYAQYTDTFSAPYVAGAYKVKVLFKLTIGEGMGAGSCIIDDVSMKETYPDLHCTAALDANHVIAAGQWGRVLFRHDGGPWAKVASGVSAAYTLRGCCMIASHAWVVGDAGTVIHSGDNGATWAAQSSGTTEDLYDVYALDANNAWAVGENGVILKFNGTSWSPETSPTSKRLRGVCGYLDGSDYYVWACGDDGALLERNKDTGNWSVQGTGSTKDFYDIKAISATEIMAVGEDGYFLMGKFTASALYLTNLMVGQRKKYHAEYNPVLDAITDGAGTLEEYYTRRKQKYNSMKGSAGDTEEWLFNVAKHEGLYLPSVGGAINNDVDYDIVTLDLQLKDTDGKAITPTTTDTVPSSINLSTASAGDKCVGENRFREIAMLGRYPYRYKHIEIPSSYVSKKANKLGINQSILLTPSNAMADGDRLLIDCLTLIPVDRAFVEVNNWRSGSLSGAQQSHMILSSTDMKVLSSLTGDVETAMVFNPSCWNGAPEFEADPMGINMTLIACMITGTGATRDYEFTPRINLSFRWKPRVLLAGV